MRVLVPPGVVNKEYITFAHDGKEFVISVMNGKRLPIEVIQRIFKPVHKDSKDNLYRQLSFNIE